MATATTVKFGVDSDDGSVLLIDGTEAANYDGNHGFAGTPVYGASRTLAAGYHSLSLKYFEWEGGEACHLYWDIGSGGVIIPASALFQGGLSGSGSFGNNMTVAAGTSTLDITDTVRLGIVTLNGGGTLNVTTPTTGKVSFSGTKLSGGAGATIATAIETHLGALNDQSLTSTLTKTGAGNLILDTAAVHGANTTIAMAGGALQVLGSAAIGSPLGGAAVELNSGNGGLVFGSKSGDYTNAGGITVNTSSTIAANASSTGAVQNANVTLGGALTVASGTATLSTADGYNLILAGPVTGNVAVAAGTVKLGASDRLAGTSTLTVSGGTFDIQTFNDTIGTLMLTGGTVAGDGVLTAGTFDLRSGFVSAALGGGAVTKTTSGTLTLAGPQSYTSVTTVSAGFLAVRSGATLGNISAGTTVASSATLVLKDGVTVSGEALTLKGSGPGSGGALRGAGTTNTWAGPITLGAASSIGTDGHTLILSGPITGAFKLTKVGPGPLILTGSGSNYTGGTDIGGGSIVAYNASSLGTGDVTFSATGTSLEVRAAGFNLGPGKKVTIATNSTLDLYQSTAVPIKFNGGTIQSHGNITAGGALTDGFVSQFATSGGTLKFTNNLAMTNDRTWTVPTAGDTVTFSGNISGSTRTLTKEGDGTLRLEGANTIGSLTIGSSGSGGYVVGKTASSVPSGAATVLINPGSAYSVEAVNHSYGEVNTMWSGGVIALSRQLQRRLQF